MQSQPILNKTDSYVSQYLLDNYESGGFHKIELGSGGVKLNEAEQKELYGTYIHNSLNPSDRFANRGNQGEQTDPPSRNIISDTHHHLTNPALDKVTF